MANGHSPGEGAAREWVKCRAKETRNFETLASGRDEMTERGRRCIKYT